MSETYRSREKEALEKWMAGQAAHREQEMQQIALIPAVYTEEDLETTEIWLPMRDGAKMKTVIVKPKNADGNNPVPALLQRTPYGLQGDVMVGTGREFAKRGLAYIVQCCRGTDGSEGTWEPNVNERNDGIDTLNWMNEQPWIESIGYFGGSYLALTGWILMDSLPEKVKAMYLSVYGTDRHTSAYCDGLFRQDILTAWAMSNAGRPVTADFVDSALYRPQAEVDRAMWDADLPWYRDWITHTDRSDPYWAEGFWALLKEMPQHVRIPLVIEEGWYDHHLGSALSGYRSMSGESLSHTLFRIGAWNHGSGPVLDGHHCEDLRNWSFRPVYEFMKKVLIDHETPGTGVLLYNIGEDRWLEAPEWPVPEKEMKLYLSAGSPEKSAPAKSGGRRLTKEAPVEQEMTEYIYDPEDPVYSHGAESCFRSQWEVGSKLQEEPDYRPDVVSFVSEPFAEPVRIAGRIKAKLFVSSDAEDTAFAVRISEVFPDGRAFNIRSGITTLGYRGHSDARQAYTPGEVVEAEVDTWDILWTVGAGSRLRIDITSSDFPQYAVHPNYPGVWALQDKTKPARQTICSGGDTPSAVVLPVK